MMATKERTWGQRIVFSIIYGSGNKLRSRNQIIQGHIEYPGYLNQDFQTWCAAALFIHSQSAGGNMELMGQLGLAQAGTAAQLCDSTGQHGNTPFFILEYHVAF